MGAGALVGSRFDSILVRTKDDLERVKAKFKELLEEGKTESLNPEQVMSLVTWSLHETNETNEKDSKDLFLRSFEREVNDNKDTSSSFFSLDEFLFLYEEAMMRTILQRLCSEGFDELDTERVNLLNQKQCAEFFNRFLIFLEKFSISESEMESLQARAASELDSLGLTSSSCNKAKLMEVIDDMIWAMWFSRRAESRFLSFDTNNDKILEGSQLKAFSDWVIRSCRNKYGRLLQGSVLEAYERLLESRMLAIVRDRSSSADEGEREEGNDINNISDSDTVQERLYFSSLPSLLETMLEKREWVQLMLAYDGATAPMAQCSSLLPTRRLSHYGVTHITDAELSRLGVAPLARDKFSELDKNKTGTIAKEEIVSLIDWIVKSYKVPLTQEEPSEVEIARLREEISFALETDMDFPLVIIALLLHHF